MALNGVKSIMFAGEGEPLLHPNIRDLIRFTSISGIDVALTSNFVAGGRDFLEESLRYITWIKVSLNGGEKSYARVHRCKEADYRKVWSNLEYAVKHRQEAGLTCTVGIQSVLLPENAQEMVDLAKRARDTGIDYFVIKPYSQHLSSHTTEYKDIRYTEYQDILAEASKLSSPTFEVVARHKSMATWDSQEHGYHKCYSTPYFWAYIMANGDVYGCSAYLLNPEFCYGNINEESFARIWKGAKRAASVERMKTLDISKCRLNCRMHKVNEYLWEVKNGSQAHANFI